MAPTNELGEGLKKRQGSPYPAVAKTVSAAMLSRA
jgi:hypothetical protein